MIAILAALALTLAGNGAESAVAQDRAVDDTGSPSRAPAALIEIEGPIGPATAEHVSRALEAAAEDGAPVAIIRLDTPGGLVTAMRDIIRDILAAPMPVLGWVGPQGARAASAGTYILYATHVAAMAPGTNLGAATPIRMDGGGILPGGGSESPGEGEDPDAEGGSGGGIGTGDAETGEDGEEAPVPASAGEAKAVNDAVAFIRSLAELRGRNADWAEEAVRQAASLSARAAAERNVVDGVAAGIPALLALADGRTVSVGEGAVTLATEGLAVETIEPGWQLRFLQIVTHPNVAFLLMLIGVYGLIFEFANPGTIGPGVVGAICLILGLYALNVLPFDATGLALMLAGIAFMVAEAFVPSFGILGIGGAAAFATGAMLLFGSDAPGYALDLWVVGLATAASAGLLVFALGFVWRAQRRPVTTGPEEMAQAHGTVLDWDDGRGHVRMHGERWQAVGPPDLAPGDAVTARSTEGLVITVAPADTAPPAGGAPHEPEAER
ncbi:MAG: nodulation protein NfeD [Azospirillaceae bacterium]